MAFEIPTDLLSQMKILIRKEAKISSYNSDDPSLFELPSLEETIAQLNPSPPYLRCKHCNGRLLRDLESIICIFCGENQITGLHPEAINFRNTVGCRWLLESLDLNGSEMAGPFIDVKEAKRGEPLNEFPLSDLLDLEIKWSPKSEKEETSASNESKVQNKSPLNLAGVDLDNFFSEGKEDKTSVFAEEQSTINKLTNKNEGDTIQPNEQLSLFEDDKPPQINKSSVPESRDSFSGWEASFQSASSSIHNEESKSIDPFAASSTDVSMQMDLVFGPQPGSTRGKAKDEVTLSSSVSDDWFQNDLWSNPSSAQHEQVDVVAKVGEKNFTENTNNSMSSSADWGKEDHWPTRKQEPDNNTADDDDDDDSFDAWNDFTSSTSTPNPVNSSWNQAFEDPVPSAKERSEINFSSTITVTDVDFTNSLDPGAFNHQNGSVGVEPLQLENSSLHRNGKEVSTSEDNAKGLDIPVMKEGDNINVAKSNSDDVQRLLAQMHDLSFMLENNLSIPPK